MDFSTETLEIITNSSIPSSASIPTMSHFRQYFSWYDYLFFAFMLAVSSSIGVYFGCFGGKQKNWKEYVTGGKKMSALPVAISLVASHTSGLSLIAVPADVYMHGATLLISVISLIVLGAIIAYVFLPVFFALEMTSIYEYLEHRFDKKCRKLASGLYILSIIVYLPMIIYAPGLSFEAVTGVPVYISTPIICGVCIFYTSLGGLKAVVWTDAIQFVATAGTMITVVVLGVRSAGGFSEIWKTSLESGRLDIFKFDLDPTKRDTFWNIVIGLTIHWMSYTSTDQDYTQKFLAVSTLKQSTRTVFLYCFGMILVKIFCVFTGLIIYNKYSSCDPLTSQVISKKDELVPYYVLEVAGHIPGLPGLFVAGIFSAALSSMSSALNALASIIYEDFLKAYLGKQSGRTASFVLKMIVVITGVISTLLVFLLPFLGGMFSVAITLMSVTHGPLFGMFVLGALLPKSNKKGAFWGTLLSLVCVTIVIGGSEIYAQMGYSETQELPVSTDGCNAAFNSSASSVSTSPQGSNLSKPFFIFRLSFYWYTMLGTLISVLSGLVISYLTSSEDDPVVGKHLLSPVVHFLVPDGPKDHEKPYKYEPVCEVSEETVKLNRDHEKNACHCQV